MSLPLKRLRSDSDIGVFAELHQYITPQKLSRLLLEIYGENRFEISLQRSVYLVYVQLKDTEENLVFSFS